jgi:GTP-binding protein EngB required for normal cell division
MKFKCFDKSKKELYYGLSCLTKNNIDIYNCDILKLSINDSDKEIIGYFDHNKHKLMYMFNQYDKVNNKIKHNHQIPP